MLIDATAAAAGIATTNPGFLAITLLKELLPLGERRVFARGQLEIRGSVTDPLGLTSFSVISDGLVFSAGRFADAILGDGIPNNEVTLAPGGRKDFAYAGAGIRHPRADYRFDPIGGGIQEYEGSASFELSSPTTIQFDIKHSMGAALGRLAFSSGFPSAGASLEDLKLSVTVPEPSSLILLSVSLLAVAGYGRRKRVNPHV
jgi:hypothetical protein